MLRKYIVILALLQTAAVTGLILADRVGQTWSQALETDPPFFLWGFVRHAGYVLYLVPLVWGGITLRASQERANIPAIVIGIILLAALTLATILQTAVGLRYWAWF